VAAIPATGSVLAVSTSDFLWFVDEALDGMTAIVRQLGDDTANRRPDLPGANSPYAILTHCLGVMEYWGGHQVAGRATQRDRDAEFRAAGSVDELLRRASAARRQLEADVLTAESLAAPRSPPEPEVVPLPYGKTQGAILLHVLEELTQHLGQMELSRDVLLAAPPVVAG